MSISPFKSSASAKSNNERLTLSQALLITAGLAGLFGLGSGAVIRFSLSNSPDASFLSPLQTFPALSSWAPELPQGTADAHYLPGGISSQSRDTFQSPAQIQTFEYSDEPATVERFDPSNFDTFAGRGNASIPTAAPSSDPFELLQSGPNTLGIFDETLENSRESLSEAEDMYPQKNSLDENYPAVEEPSFDDSTYYGNEDQW